MNLRITLALSTFLCSTPSLHAQTTDFPGASDFPAITRPTGSVDRLAYAGLTTTSTFSTYSAIASQLKAAGYTEIYTCARATCGSAYHLATYLTQPLINSTHQGDWAHWMIDDLYAANDDIRYGTFRRGAEYLCVLAALVPGHPAGALLIRIANPSSKSVLQP
jgi:hypothetical protein